MKLGKKGFINPRIVKTVSFTLITLCIIGSIVLSIMAIWNYGDRDTLWRLIATLVVVGVGAAIFAFINGAFGD